MTPLALFDLDNTLVDRQAAYVGWVKEFVADRGLDSEAVTFLIEVDEDGHAGRERVFDAARRRFSLSEDVESLIAHYRATYLHWFAPDPAVNQALVQLRELGWRIGIVTNGPSTQQEKIDRAGLTPLVDATCISDLVGVAKPDRRIFDEAVQRCLGTPVPTGPAWMVGDTPIPDVAGGRGAGLRTVWMHRGRAWGSSAFRPDVTAATISEAVSIMVDDEVAPG